MASSILREKTKTISIQLQATCILPSLLQGWQVQEPEQQIRFQQGIWRQQGAHWIAHFPLSCFIGTSPPHPCQHIDSAHPCLGTFPTWFQARKPIPKAADHPRRQQISEHNGPHPRKTPMTCRSERRIVLMDKNGAMPGEKKHNPSISRLSIQLSLFPVVIHWSRTLPALTVPFIPGPQQAFNSRFRSCDGQVGQHEGAKRFYHRGQMTNEVQIRRSLENKVPQHSQVISQAVFFHGAKEISTSEMQIMLAWPASKGSSVSLTDNFKAFVTWPKGQKKGMYHGCFAIRRGRQDPTKGIKKENMAATK